MYHHISLHIYRALVPETKLGVLHRVAYVHLHKNQQKRYSDLVMSEEAEAQLDQPMDLQLVVQLSFYRGMSDSKGHMHHHYAVLSSYPLFTVQTKSSHLLPPCRCSVQGSRSFMRCYCLTEMSWK